MQPLFRRLRRITSKATWIPEVDGLRFLAIFAVILYHINQQLLLKAVHALTSENWYRPVLTMVSNGSRGVELFFVISGFVLGLPFARYALVGEPPISIRNFYLRRLTRLEPPYVFNLVVLTIAIVIHDHAHLPHIAPHFLASALYIHELVYKRVSTINPVTWTLEIEVQFYLLVPLLALFYRLRTPAWRRGGLIAAIFAVAALAQYSEIKNFWENPEWWLYSSVFFYLQYLLTGMLLSDLYLTLLPRLRPHLAWDLASLCCWTAYFYETVPWDTALLPVLLFVSFIGAFRGIYFPRFFRMNAIAITGGMSYSIYLWHFFLIAIFFKVTRHLALGNDALANLVMQCVLLAPAILFFSVLLFIVVERPCMDRGWPRKLLNKIKAAAG